jgi:predicted nucleic acid-binding protein
METPRRSAEVFAALSSLMDQHRLTAYDAAYLEIAIRRNLPLATLDQALINACKAVGKALISNM